MSRLFVHGHGPRYRDGQESSISDYSLFSNTIPHLNSGRFPLFPQYLPSTSLVQILEELLIDK